jgi:AGZA family xanthine/uracil permease-like MFS transporter
MWPGVFLGGVLSAILILYRVKGALLIGITLVTIVSWPRGTEVTAFPHTAMGDTNFAFFKRIVTFKPLTMIANALDVRSSSYFLLMASDECSVP